MVDIEIPLPEVFESEIVERAIDNAIAEAGLTVRLRGSLKKYPGCIHWHVKEGKLSGTLEITLWQRARRAWFTVQSGRRATWIEECIPALSNAIQTRVERDMN